LFVVKQYFSKNREFFLSRYLRTLFIIQKQGIVFKQKKAQPANADWANHFDIIKKPTKYLVQASTCTYRLSAHLCPLSFHLHANK
jgi:hypothetical protein